MGAGKASGKGWGFLLECWRGVVWKRGCLETGQFTKTLETTRTMEIT